MTKKISIIGAGEIGSKTLAAVLKIFPKDQPLEITFLNRTLNRAEGEYRDVIGITDADYLYGVNMDRSDLTNFKINVTSKEEEIKNSDVIIFTAGVSAATIGSSKREAALPFVKKLINHYGNSIKTHAPDSLVLMITNPVDISTWLMQDVTGFESGRVIGSGAELDARRFRRFFRWELEKIGIKLDKIDGVVIGGHSAEEMIVPESSVKINGIAFREVVKNLDEEEQNKVRKALEIAKEMMKKEGFEIVKLKGHGASFEPAILLAAMASSYLSDKKINITASYILDELENYYEINGKTSISVPVTIGNRKVKLDNNLQLNDQEKKLLGEISKDHQKLFYSIKNMSNELVEKVEQMLKDLESQKKNLEKENKNIRDFLNGFSRAENTNKLLDSIYHVSQDKNLRYIKVGVNNNLADKSEYLLNHIQSLAEENGITDINLDKDNKVLRIENTRVGEKFLRDIGLNPKGQIIQAKF